ncbi:hypothetical protein QYE76_041163 [Lolium multiflorum]|uniref:Uncharacterized protein n=1 Tax=Lolium multiflorum TaxID=4521 RepID=A0AAD8TCD1_LOLMU|nr:hypothetical protein QYE76_041163 [Lolium multiflorum]
MYDYSGHDDTMRASKDNLSSDTLDRQIRVMIKIPRYMHTHLCNLDIHTGGAGIALEALEEKDLGTLTRVPHPGNTNPEAASDAVAPEAPEAPAKRKRGATHGPAAKRVREAPSASSTSTAAKARKPTSSCSSLNPDSGKGASSSMPPPEEPEPAWAEAPTNDAPKKLLLSGATVWGKPETEQQDLTILEDNLRIFFAKHKSMRQNTRQMHEDLRTLVLKQKAEIEKLTQKGAEDQQAIAHLQTRLKNNEEELANRPSVDEISAELEVLKAKHTSLHNFLKESAEKETKAKKELEEKHAQAMSELPEKLKTSHQRVKTLVSKA